MTTPTIESFGLSPLQAHLAHLAHSGKMSAVPCCARIRIQGKLEAKALQAALAQVAEQHEILRTSFPTLPGTHAPVQVIGQSLGLSFEEHRFALPEPEALDELEERLKSAAFVLESNLNLRAALVHFSDEEHLLFLVQNPLSSDATSLWNLTRCLGAALAGEALPGFQPESRSEDDGEEDAGPLQMADVAQWFNDNFEEPESRAGLAFWSALDPSAARITLPLAYDRGGERFEPEACAREWSADDEEALQRFAEAQATSADGVLCAVWNLLLARLSSRDEFISAILCDGRAFDGLPDALGPFARFLPLPLQIDKHASLAQFLGTVERARLEAQQNYETFDYRRAGWDPAQPLAFACAFHAPLAPLRGAELCLSLEARGGHGEPFQLLLELDRGVSEPELSLHFDPRYFGGLDAALVLEQFDDLLESVLSGRSQEIGQLPWLSEGARRHLLDNVVAGAALEPAERCVHEAFSEQAALYPERVAVRAANGNLTYAQLEQASNRLANHLVSIGVAPGSFVGLYLNRCVEQIVAILGVFKAGAAYLPLPPDYPAERIAFMLRDTQAAVVLSTAAQRGDLEAFQGTLICLDACDPLSESSSAAPRTIEGMQHDAYVIFTSGSTGNPKGVPISHANLAASTKARLSGYAHPVSCYLVLSSFAFDSSVAGLYWALVQGGCLALPPDGFEEDIASLAALFEEYEVSHTLALPSLWDMILDAASPGQLDALCTVIVAGESSSRDLVAKHKQALPDCELVNEYGPTEGTVWSSYYDCLQDFERANVPIGRPIPGARIFIVNSELELMPMGQAGELLVSGPGVARGYLGRPELSAERFVTRDFGAGDEYCYRTGDLARFLPDAELEFLGRIDHQVKIRGYRIELEEIEARLLAQDYVKEAVVIAREDTPGDKRLVAYLTAKGSPPDPRELRAALARDLPDYMLPAHFVIQDGLPLLPNGKLDRNNLAPPEASRSLSSSVYRDPETPLEKLLVALWCDVLGLERVGADDDFFELGGHSILATRLFARLVDLLQSKLSLRAIFDARTPAALATLMLVDEQEASRLESVAEVVLEVLEMDEDEASAAAQ